MEVGRKNMSLAKQLTRSLKLSQRLTVAHTKAMRRTQKVNAKRAASEGQTRRTTD